MKSKHVIQKTVSAILFTCAFLAVHAQHDTLYIMKGGVITGKYNIVTELDSIVFYRPTVQSANSITDARDGIVYQTVKIGNQIWFKENLRATRYQNGDLIPNVKDDMDWINAVSGAWCHYDNDDSYDGMYGKLYNFYAASDPRNLAPVGWHVSTLADWKILIAHAGGVDHAGTKLKDTINWIVPNIGATNETGFSALPGGLRSYRDGWFWYLGDNGHFYTSTPETPICPWSFDVDYMRTMCAQDRGVNTEGFSVRCVKDDNNQDSISRGYKEWNISRSQFIPGAYRTNHTIDGLNFILKSGDSLTINDVTVRKNNNQFFAQRLFLSGAGKPDAGTYKPTTKAVSFYVSGQSIITVYCLSTSATVERELILSTENNSLYTFNAAMSSYSDLNGNTVPVQTYQYTGGPEQLYLYSPNSSVNLYCIRVDYISTN